MSEEPYTLHPKPYTLHPTPAYDRASLRGVLPGAPASTARRAYEDSAHVGAIGLALEPLARSISQPGPQSGSCRWLVRAPRS